MATEKVTFGFVGDTLTVGWDGNVWISPHNGQQHSRIGQAVRAECEAYLLAAGDDPAEYAGAINNAIGEAALAVA